MRVRQPAAWQRVLALAPLLLVFVSLPAQVLLRCRMDGQVRSACCCSSHEEAATAPTDSALKSACCCDREISKRQVPSLASATSASQSLGPAVAILLAPLATLLQPEPESVRRTLLRARPAREGPPLLLLKQSFLI